MPPAMPPLVCTGFDITHTLQRYLEVGHNIDVVQAFNEAWESADTEESPDDSISDSDRVLLELDRETAFLESLQEHFSRIRDAAPAEDRTVLEVPYSFEKRLPDNWHTRLFIPTGAYPRAQYKAAAVKPPFERDLKAIESFIECANRLLPDDTARERAGLKLGDLRYTARSPRDLHPPFYLEARREDRVPPRPVREYLASLAQ